MRIVRSLILSLSVFFLMVPVSHANMKKGKIGAGGTRTFSFSITGAGSTTVALIFDNPGTDLDLSLGETDGDLIATSISGESFFELLQAGLAGSTKYLVVVYNVHGDATPFRIVVSTGQQESISTAATSDALELQEIDMNAGARRLLDQLKRVEKNKQ